MATVTLTFNAATATRIQEALDEMIDYTDENGDARQATEADFKNYLVAKTKQFVKTAEKRIAERAIAPDEVVIG